LHTIAAPNGATQPVDERAAEERADKLSALTRSALEGNINVRPADPPRWATRDQFGNFVR
jgi:hypothetical protein